MKNKYALKLLFILTLSIPSAIASIGPGGQEGHGGSVIQLPDGKIVLADPFLVNGTKTISMNPKFKNYLTWINRMLGFYEGKTETLNSSFSSVLFDLDKVHVVESLPEKLGCKLESSSEQGPTQNQIIAMCTTSQDTYVVKNLIQRMSLADLASLYLHEKLHVWVNVNKPDKNKNYDETHFSISQITSGIRSVLEILYRQNKGEYTSLSDSEYNSVFMLRQALPKITDSNLLSDYVIHTNGGGLINKIIESDNSRMNAKTHESTFIGVSSIIQATQFNIGENVKLIHSSLVSDSKIVILSESKITNSYIQGVTGVSIQRGAQITSSNIKGRLVKIEEGTSILESQLLSGLASELSIWNIKTIVVPHSGKILIGKNTQIKNTVINLDFFMLNDQTIKVKSTYYGREVVKKDRNSIATYFDLLVGEQSKINSLIMESIGTKEAEYSNIESNLDKTITPLFKIDSKVDLNFETDPYLGCENLKTGYQSYYEIIQRTQTGIANYQVAAGGYKGPLKNVIPFQLEISSKEDIYSKICQ